MTAVQQEIVPKCVMEAQEGEESGQEIVCETTKELFRRDEVSPAKDKTPQPPQPPTIKSPSKHLPLRNKSNSGIPRRMKTGTGGARTPRSGTYRPSSQIPLSPFINKNTLEMQFMNNKKRLLKLHGELVEKQRPLLEMHKALLRTKKQLEGLGKKVALEDLKIVSLKTGDLKSQQDSAGDNPAAETADHLKNSIENTLEECVKVCKKCFEKRDHVVKILENASKSTMEPAQIEAELQELSRDQGDSQELIESTIKDNEKKIAKAINDWLKAASAKSMSEEATAKIADLEDTIKQQEKIIQEHEENSHSIGRRFDEKKVNYEKALAEAQEKNSKLEEELKKEKKMANENLMKSRNMRSKVGETETRAKEIEEKCNEMTNKLKQLQEQMRRKEVQWVKEKEEFKKSEALLQQRFSEKQSQFDARLNGLEELQKLNEKEKISLNSNFEMQMQVKEQEIAVMRKERSALEEKKENLAKELAIAKAQMLAKDQEITDLKAIPVKEHDSWTELQEYKKKVSEVQYVVQQQAEQISKMQNSLKAHANLAAALKVEKDNALTYSDKLRGILQEARDELDYKNKTVYKIHEKLVLKEKQYEKLKRQLTEYQETGDRSPGNKCPICMASLNAETPEEVSSFVENEVGKCNLSSPQYVSESLIGMSVKKVDHLRARLDNLKKMKLPGNPRGKQLNVNYSWSACQTNPITSHLRKQIEMRGKLYQTLQKHADQSCEDFINLLKLTVSNNGKGMQRPDELKPSNTKNIDGARSRKTNISDYKAFSSYFGHLPINEICDSINESSASDTDESPV